MICRAIPYEGAEPYIFASYCHADKESLSPLFEQIVLSGYRMWYDDGNHGGDDWLDNIENHLEECSVCLAFISGNSSLSHNCKSEIIYALKCNKKIIPVLIDGADLPKGLRMQLSHLHYLKRSDYYTDQQLLQKIFEAEECQKCKAPAGSLHLRQNGETQQTGAQHISSAEDFWDKLEHVQINKDTSQSSQDNVPDNHNERIIEITKSIRPDGSHSEVITDRCSNHVEIREYDAQGNFVRAVHGTFAEELKTNLEEKNTDLQAVSKYAQENSQQENPAWESTHQEPDDESTVYQSYIDAASLAESKSDVTVFSAHVGLALLFHPAANKCFVLRKPQTKLGRSPIKCDAVIEGNNSISKYHADIIQVDQKVFLRDVNSTNGTFIHHNRMEAGSQIELDNPAIFQLTNETLVLINGDDAWKMWQDRSAVFLMNEDHTSVQFMKSDVMYLDRNHKWPDGTLSDKKIHRAGHARLQKKNGSVYLVDEAPNQGNGTYLNDTRLIRGSVHLLSSGDKIRLGDTTLFFSAITI